MYIKICWKHNLFSLNFGKKTVKIGQFEKSIYTIASGLDQMQANLPLLIKSGWSHKQVSVMMSDGSMSEHCVSMIF